MPTKNFLINKEQSLAEVSGNDRGSGGDTHLPIGKSSFDSNYIFRGLQRFTNDWSGMTKVTKIVYKAKLTTGIHTENGSSRRVQFSRLTAGFTEAGGGENSWAYGHSGTVWPGPTGAGTIDLTLTGYDDSDWVSLDITSMYDSYIPSTVLDPAGNPGAGATNNGLRVWSYDETTYNRSFEFYGKDSGSEPYLIVTYTTNTAPAKPAPTHPVSEVITAGGSPVFSWGGSDPDVGDTLAAYDLQLSVTSDFASLHYNGVGLTAGTISGFNVTNAPYAGGALTAGMTYYWRVRNKDAAGAYSPWSDGKTFTMGAIPTVTGQEPAALGLAGVWNLGSATPWSTGAVAGSIHKFTYNHPTSRAMKAYRFRIYNAAGTLATPEVVITKSASSGTEIVHNCTFAIVNGTQMKWAVEVQDVDGNWSATMAATDFKVRWGQAVYAHSVGVNANNLKVVAGPLAGTGAQMTLAYQEANDAAGSGGSAWVTDVGSLAPTTKAYIRVLVRLAATVSGQNPALSDLTLTYAGSASLPDKWTVSGGGHTFTLDSTQRRFGYYSGKMTAGAVSAFYIYPWRRVNTDGVLVTADTDYVFSMYVKTNGNIAPAVAQLMIRATSFTGTPYTTYPQAPGTVKATSNTTTFPDGWQRLMASFHVPPGVTQVWPTVWFSPSAIGQSIWVDGGKLEEGRVTSLWTPGFLGEAITLDAMGVTIDAGAGGILRLRGSVAGIRDTVELSANGLTFGGDTEVSSPAAGVITFPAHKFPAVNVPSTDVNTLDDYEEGTYTPTVSPQTVGDFAATYTTQFGRYVKVGRMVTFWVRLACATFTWTTASGFIRVGGLPFTPMTLAGMQWPVTANIRYTKAGYSTVNGILSSGDPNVYFVIGGSGFQPTLMAIGDVPTASLPQIYVAGSYETNL